MERGEKTFLSVIIPVYNVENYLARCIDSIIQYIPKDLKVEILLIDDGSMDNSSFICDEYAEKIEYVYSYHFENAGLSEARNRGIEIAKGEYIFFIDSDDYLLGNLFDRFLKYLNKYPNVDVYQFRCVIVYDDYKQENDEKIRVQLFNREDAFKQLLLGKLISRMVTDKIYKRSLFENIRFPIGFLAEDYGTTYKTISNANVVLADNSGFYGYYQRNDSIMGMRSTKLILDEYKLGEDFYKFGLKEFPKLKMLIETENLNLQIKTFCRLRTKNEDNENLDYLIDIKRKIRSRAFTRTRLRTKIVQLLFLINSRIVGFLLEKRKSY